MAAPALRRVRPLRLTAALLATSFLTSVAHAQDATWSTTPGSNDWNTGANWTPTTVPTGIASFGASTTTSLTFSAATTSIGTMQFNSGAPAYTFTIPNIVATRTLTVNGTGIVNNSTNAPIFALNTGGTLSFVNSSTAANAAIQMQFGTLSFSNNSNAGTATVTMANSLLPGFIQFHNTSSAANASFTLTETTNAQIPAELVFFDASTAANATIVNNPGTGSGGARTEFGVLGGADTSTAANAHITNNDQSSTAFYARTTGANATIVNNATGQASFRDQSSAANATITNNAGGNLFFAEQATAGNATVINNGGSVQFGFGLGFGDSATAGNAKFTNINGGAIQFFDATTAGNASFDINGVSFSASSVTFRDNSKAGSATFNLGSGASLQFHNTSSADHATINLHLGSFPPSGVSFLDSSTAGNATIHVASFLGSLSFSGNSTAANATIIGDPDTGSVVFSGASSAGNAAITTGSGLFFEGNSTAGNATITLNAATLNAARVSFLDASSGGSARFIVNGNSRFDMSSLTVAGMTAGSIEGAGNFFLGGKQLTVGGNNLSTEVSGVIADGGSSGGAGASLVKTGTGTMVLSSNNTYTGGTTISGGVLQLGNGGTSGSIVGNVTNNATFAFNHADAITLGGVISGIGAVQQIGTGNTILTATNTYTGATTINAGTLSVNGSIASSSGLTVNAGGTIGGTGALPKTTINGGTLSPGNSIGTVAITGSLTFVGAGNYVVEVSPSTADRANVSGAPGTAVLAGALKAVGTGGSFTVGTRYTVLNATGGVSGTFGSLSISGSFGVTRPHVEYDANNVYLVLDQNQISLGGLTPNQLAIAGAVNTALMAGNQGAPFVALFGLTAAQLPGALDALSGEVHASTAGVLMDESFYMRSAILSRLRQASYGSDMGTVGTMAALKVGGPQAAFANGEELNGALAYAKSPIVTKAPMKAPEATSDVVFWAQGFGAWGRFTGDGNAATVSRDLAGFITGVDTRVGANGRAGLAAGYTSSRNTLDGRGNANVESGHVAAYGGWSFGALNLRAGGAYAFHTIDTDRSIAFPGFFDRATARYDGGTGQVFGEAGYGFAFGNVAVEPFAGGAWVRVQTDGAAERTMLAGLNFAGTSFEVGYSSLGIRAASLVALENGMVLIPRGSLAWQHAFNSVTPNAVLAFQATPNIPFTIAGVPIARDAALAEAGLDLALNSHATIGVSYTGQIASNVQDHAAKGRFSWKF